MLRHFCALVPAVACTASSRPCLCSSTYLIQSFTILHVSNYTALNDNNNHWENINIVPNMNTYIEIGITVTFLFREMLKFTLTKVTDEVSKVYKESGDFVED